MFRKKNLLEMLLFHSTRRNISMILKQYFQFHECLMRSEYFLPIAIQDLLRLPRETVRFWKASAEDISDKVILCRAIFLCSTFYQS